MRNSYIKYCGAFFLALMLIFSVGQAFADVDFGKVPYNIEIRDADGNIGDAAAGALYDVRDLLERTDKWENYLTIQNTTNKWVALQLRFRSSTKSIEVYDHIILLSPYDVFWLALVRDPVGGVTGYSYDTETLMNSGFPVDASGGTTFKFSTLMLHENGFFNGAGEELDALAETEMGEIEIIGLWSIIGSNPKNFVGLPNLFDFISFFANAGYITSHNINEVAYDATGDGLVNVYDIMYLAWGGLFEYGSSNGPRPDEWWLPDFGFVFPYTIPYIVGGADVRPRALIDCPNSLAATMEQGDILTGQYAAYNFVGLMNFRTDVRCDDVEFGDTGFYHNAYHRDDYQSGAIVFPIAVLRNGPNISNSRCYGASAVYEIAYYLNPDYATASGPTWRDGNAKNGFVTGQDFKVKAIYNYNDFAASQIAWFNSSWSLSDVEAALAKTEIWQYYLDFVFSSDVSTRTVFTFLTKYLHFYFAEIGPYVTNGQENRKFAFFPFWTNGYVACGDYSIGVTTYRSYVKAAYDGINNGPISVAGAAWDTDENLKSGLIPSPQPDTFALLRHEVNNSKIHDPENIYNGAAFNHGQLVLYYWRLLNGQRPFSGYVNQLPIIGGTIRLNNVPNSPAVTRSTWLDWLYKVPFYFHHK